MEVVPGQEFDLPLDVGDAEVSAVAFHPDKPVAYVAAGEHLFGSPPPPHSRLLSFLVVVKQRKIFRFRF